MSKKPAITPKSVKLSVSNREKPLYLADAEEYYHKKNTNIIKNHIQRAKRDMQEVTGTPDIGIS